MSVSLSQLTIIIIFFTINLFAFMVMLVDKIKSRNEQSRRISEGMMFFLASIFGSLGVYAGMFAFRHKTRKWYFLVGIPVLIVENLAFLYLLYVLSGKVEAGLLN